MVNLVVCCDGTWSVDGQRHRAASPPSYVARLFDLVAERDWGDAEQKKYYHAGGDTDGNLSGDIGPTLGRNIQSAYGWLCRNYQPRDNIYLFGFSRGAYTARSVAGLMARHGLLNLTGVPDNEAQNRIETLFRSGP